MKLESENQPSNLLFARVGATNTISSSVILYVKGLDELFVPPFKLYVILYTIASHAVASALDAKPVLHDHWASRTNSLLHVPAGISVTI